MTIILLSKLLKINIPLLCMRNLINMYFGIVVFKLAQITIAHLNILQSLLIIRSATER